MDAPQASEKAAVADSARQGEGPEALSALQAPPAAVAESARREIQAGGAGSGPVVTVRCVPAVPVEAPEPTRDGSEKGEAELANGEGAPDDEARGASAAEGDATARGPDAPEAAGDVPATPTEACGGANGELGSADGDVRVAGAGGEAGRNAADVAERPPSLVELRLPMWVASRESPSRPWRWPRASRDAERDGDSRVLAAEPAVRPDLESSVSGVGAGRVAIASWWPWPFDRPASEARKAMVGAAEGSGG